MNKDDISNFLDQNNIWYQKTEHKRVYNMDELNDIYLPFPEYEGKNLFLRDAKKKNYYLITVKGDKRVDLKKVKQEHGTRPLSFASSEDLLRIMNLTPGSVTPLGILNDQNLEVIVYLDKEFLKDKGIIGVHPNDNTATVWLKVNDLLDIINKHGNSVKIIDI